MALLPQNLLARANAVGQELTSTINNVSSSIQQSANVITNAANSISATINGVAGAVNNLNAAVSGGLNGDFLGGTGVFNTPAGVIENKLSKYASYNYVFTLGCLANYEINNPDLTYRKRGPSIVILKSGGTGDNQVQHLYDKERGSRTEYFIDDVNISCMMTPNPKTKQTNATSISFTVTEPYSMGMFLQSLQVAALQGGHKNYIEAPYLLQVEFVGWDDNGNFINVPQTKRMFPIKFSNTEFEVTEAGSVYEVTAVPWHEQAFADEVQELKTDIDIEGETLTEMLQTGPNSLAVQLNTREVEQENAGNKALGDQYVILFPTKRSTTDEQLAGGSASTGGATTQSDASSEAEGIRDLTDKQKQDLFETLTGIENGDVPADFDAEVNKILGLVVRRSALGESIRDYAELESNVNAIGKSKIAKSHLDSGKTYFGKPAFVEDEKNPGTFKRGDIVITQDSRKIQFPKGAKVQDIIEELVLLSEYGRQFITEEPDTNGMKSWFRIESDVYNVTDTKNVEQTGRSPRVYVYRVIPYKVQNSRISAPTQVPQGYDNLKNQILKEYNYIYTGKNDDIINFNININSAFFTAIQSDFGQLSSDSVNASREKMTSDDETFTGGAPEGRPINSQAGIAGTATKTKDNSGGIGSGTQINPETQIARSFNDAILNSNVDLVSAEFEIWGDPYYIADSGMGNYNASETSNINITSDGSVDYQQSEVDIYINFRTPLDIRKDGFMDFPGLGTKPVGAFSGIYMVTQVSNKFSGGQFTQELTTIRRRNQETDTGGAKPLPFTAAVVEKPGAVLSPMLSQVVPGNAFSQFNSALASLGGIQGAASGLASDLSGVLNGLDDVTGNLQGAAAQLSNLASGKLPAGFNAAATNLQNAANTGVATISNAANNLRNSIG